MTARGLTAETASRTEAPTDLRMGTVTAVTSRGITVNVNGGSVVNASHLGSYAPAVGDPVALLYSADSWMALGRPVGPGTGVDNVTPGSSAGVALIGGCVLSGTNTTMATSTGAAVTVPRYTASMYHPLNHWVRVEAGYSWFSSVLNDIIQVRLIDAITGTVVGYSTHAQASSASIVNYSSVSYLAPPATFGGRAVRYYLELQRFSGSGTSRIDDLPTRRGFICAYDIGDGAVLATV